MYQLGHAVVTAIGAIGICALSALIPYWIAKPFCKPSSTSISRAEREAAAVLASKKRHPSSRGRNP